MMSYPDKFLATGSPPDAVHQFMPFVIDLRLPLQNLSIVCDRMDSVQSFLSKKVNSNIVISQHQMSLVSDEITAAVHQVIVNGVKNNFKRSHFPKMFSCNRKNFSVVADLKSHMKHCGENKWKCSCGTSFP